MEEVSWEDGREIIVQQGDPVTAGAQELVGREWRLERGEEGGGRQESLEQERKGWDRDP